MSIFNSPPPDYSLKNVMQLIKVHYGINSKVKVLNSERDQNFLCKVGKKKYVLKISNPDEEKMVLEMQNICTKYIKKNDPLIQVPLGFKEVKMIKDKKRSLFIRLVEYLPGKLLVDVDQHHNLLYELGSFLGRLRIAMNGFDHPAGHRDFPWDVGYIDFIKKHKYYLKSKESLVDYFINQYEQIVLPITSKLRKALIHNDGNDHNVLVNKYGKICGIIDFGDMVYTYIACEPAVCMAYVVLGKKEPLESIIPVLKGFHERFPLTLLEVSVLIYMVCIRLCITITMASYRKQLFPDNKYITITENQAISFLEKMKNEDLHNWSNKLVRNVKL